MFGSHDVDQYEAFKDTVASTSEDFQDFDVSDFITDDLLEAINDFDRDEIIAEAKAYE